MKNELNKNSTGLAIGGLVAIMHFGWLVLVGIGVAKAFYDWILELHHISLPFTILPFDIVNAILLLVVTFVGGYIFGWVFAAIWNMFCQKK